MLRHGFPWLATVRRLLWQQAQNGNSSVTLCTPAEDKQIEFKATLEVLAKMLNAHK